MGTPSRRILFVLESERFGAEMLRCVALSRCRQRPWLYALPATAQFLSRSRWCAGFAQADAARWENDLHGAIADHALLVGATHVVSDQVSLSIALAELENAISPARAFPSPTAHQLRTLDNKATFSTLARDLGLPMVESVVIPDDGHGLPSGLEYPVVLKPPDSAGGIGIRFCPSQADLTSELSKWPTYPQLVQRYIAGSDVHLTFLADDGALLAWELHEPHPNMRVRYRACRFFHDEQAVNVGRQLAEAMRYRGIANLDFRRDFSGKLWLLECNPRMYARMSLAAQAGVNFVELGLDLADGLRPRHPVIARAGVVYSPLALPALIAERHLREVPRAIACSVSIACSDPGLALGFGLQHMRNSMSSTRASKKTESRISLLTARSGAGTCP